MAENAVHISTTEHTKPTIFELWAQDSLMATLKPAFKIICEIISTKNVPSHSWILKWNEEIFLVLNLFLQYKYICKYNASFSEAFYGLKRIPLGSNGEALKLNHKVKSIISVVLVPYFISKLRAHFDKFVIQNQVSQLENPNRNIDKKPQMLFKSIFLLMDCVRFYYYISYMTGNTKIHSILDKFSGIEITHEVQQAVSWSEIFQNITTNPKNVSFYLPILIKLASQTLEFGAFFIQFLNWWQTNDVNRSVGSLPIPPPPPQFPLAKSFSDNICPICSQKRKAEVVLRTSGIVYCYPCIKNYLEYNKLCPITNVPASEKDLIRLYVQ